jgi:hypothetical protein
MTSDQCPVTSERHVARARRDPEGAASLAALLALVLALFPGCVSVDSGLPATVPEHRYATPRAVMLAIPPERARVVLGQMLSRARSPWNDPISHAEATDRFTFSWSAGTTNTGAFVSRRESHDFDFRYAEVEAVPVDMTQVGGQYGVKLRRGGEDVPYAYVCLARLEDAETLCDALAILRRP